MKKIFVPAFIVLVVSSLLMTRCENPAQKTEDARQDVSDAQAKLEQAKTDSIEYVDAKQRWAEQIERNQTEIDSFKLIAAKEKLDAMQKDQIRIKQLEKRNDELKESLKDFKSDGQETWKAFKNRVDLAVDEFDRELSEIGQSLKNSVSSDKK